jgi:hypothetical protein
MNDTARMQDLRDRERWARARIAAAARGLGTALAGGADRTRREHPWALPVVGFCAGLLVPFLVPSRRPRERPPARGATPSRMQGAWADARTAAADTLSQALAAVIRRLLDAPSSSRAPENSNGRSE